MALTPDGPKLWVQFNSCTQTYETGDDTRVAAELADNARSLADILHIANIREQQRATITAARARLGTHPPPGPNAPKPTA